MVEIPLTNGLVAIVDDEDAWVVDLGPWSAWKKPNRETTYARRARRINGAWTAVLMHQLILPTDKEIDHKDRDGLNNRRSNLRVATTSQNQANRPKRKGCKSRYKGVSTWPNGRWRAYVRADRRFIHLGLYPTEEEAARAYDKAAKEHFGEFALLNFP